MSYTLYDILEVSSRASPEMIRTAYRTLARQYHPDKNPRAGTAAVMADINRAYSILSDPLKRRGYDASLVMGGTQEFERPRRRSRESKRERPGSQSPGGAAGAFTQQAPNSKGQPRDTGKPRNRQNDAQWTPAPLPVRRGSAKKQWALLALVATVGSIVAGAFANAFKDIEVTDGKEVEIAGQWRRYNEMAPYEAANANFTGQGAPLNYEKARELYLKIAVESRARKTPVGLLDERGRLALRRLGEMYSKGLGVGQDWAQARIFYEEAAKSGDIASMAALADYFAAEQAAHTDLLAAYSWYNKLAAVTPGSYAFANAGDNSEAYRLLAEAPRKRAALEKRLSADELRRAQSL